MSTADSEATMKHATPQKQRLLLLWPGVLAMPRALEELPP